jgi:NTP pyrophosphatase (non-canonical NTP hydrolase)
MESINGLNEYQEKAGSFIVPTSTANERLFGLLAEAGEVAGCFQRMFRGDYGADVMGDKLIKELGDCLWYIAGIARDNNWTLEEVAKVNLDKLESRRLRNLLVGKGDDR